jgi:hypothetical protein
VVHRPVDGQEIWGVQEVVGLDHGAGHVVRPFEHLWADVDQKCAGGPAAKYHDAVSGFVFEEESHGSAGSQ